MVRLYDLIYTLPPDLIAQFPSKKRDCSKLLFFDKRSRKITHTYFNDVARFFKKGDLLVLNTTKVYRARLFGFKRTGGKIEILIVKRISAGVYEVLSRGARLKEKVQEISFRCGKRLVKSNIFKRNNTVFLELRDKDYNALLESGALKVPLPPYIKRPAAAEDEILYQTIYAKHNGSIAAPTAGFHFTESLLQKLKAKGVKIAHILLHIGYGTFKPISSDDVKKHIMHPEYICIGPVAAGAINQCMREKRRIIGVGTSVVRALESAYSAELDKVIMYNGFTELFIAPGYTYSVVNGIITNFHLPKTTLLSLVCAFLGKDVTFKLYKEAISRRYRFYSYGDSMFAVC